MKVLAKRYLIEGICCLMPAGAPVRFWITTTEGKRMLTPAEYTPVSFVMMEPEDQPRYLPVKIGRVNLPYVVVWYEDAYGREAIWLDSRKVRLYVRAVPRNRGEA